MSIPYVENSHGEAWYVMALVAYALDLHGLGTDDIFEHEQHNLLPKKSSNNLVSLSFMTTCVHSYVAHNLTHGPPQLLVMLLWKSHKGEEFHHMIFCTAFHHK